MAIQVVELGSALGTWAILIGVTITAVAVVIGLGVVQKQLRFLVPVVAAVGLSLLVHIFMPVPIVFLGFWPQVLVMSVPFYHAFYRLFVSYEGYELERESVVHTKPQLREREVVMCEDCGGSIYYRGSDSSFVCSECGRIICESCATRSGRAVLCRECTRGRQVG